MTADRPLTKRELLRELGITDRLLKFWVNWYKLELNRRGRGSTYPAHTVDRLRLIKSLANSRYFTMRFVKDLLQAEGDQKKSIDAYLDTCRTYLRRPAGPVPIPRLIPKPISAVRVSESWDAPKHTASAATVVAEKRVGEDLL